MVPKKFSPNRAQLSYILNPANLSTNVMGRASGKSTIISWTMKEAVRKMPKGSFLFHGSTYVDMMSNSLPGTIEGLALLGYIQDVNFTFGNRPPKKWNWDKPLLSVIDAQRTFFFPNGATFRLSSQDRTARGSSVDGVLADEVLMLNKEKFERDILPTNRGHIEQFGREPMHNFVHLFSSMPYSSKGGWITDFGNYYEELGHNYRQVKNRLVDVELAFVDSTDAREQEALWIEIWALKKQLRYFTHVDDEGQNIYYSEGDCFDNILNLGVAYIRQQRKILTDLSFKVEMLNWFPTKLEDSFYANLDLDTHTYTSADDFSHIDGLGYDFEKLKNRDCRWDADLDPHGKLEVSVDWGAHINCMSVNQMQRKVFRTIKDFYVKPDKILDHLIKDFTHYYRFHKRKEVDFWYDPSGRSRMANSPKTYVEQAVGILREKGWHVNQKDIPNNISHKVKHLLINLILSEQRDDMPVWRANYTNAKNVVTSMVNTPVKDVDGKLTKDKSSERNLNIPQEEATHFGDAQDIIFWGRFSHHIQSFGDHWNMPL